MTKAHPSPTDNEQRFRAARASVQFLAVLLVMLGAGVALCALRAASIPARNWALALSGRAPELSVALGVVAACALGLAVVVGFAVRRLIAARREMRALAACRT